MADINFVLRKLGLHAKLKGYHYLATAVRLVMQDEDYMFSLTTQLYPQVALRYGTTASCVDRNMRTAVQIIWERGNMDFLQSVAGYAFPYKPTTGEMIDILVAYCQSHPDSPSNN